MRAWVRVVIMSICVTAGLLVACGWAEEGEQLAATPEEVVTKFGDTLPMAMVVGPEHWQEVNRLLTKQSQQTLGEFGKEILDRWMMWMVFPQLVPGEVSQDGDTATVVAVPQRRPVHLKLVKEDGQWKIDLLTTMNALPEPFRPVLEPQPEAVSESPAPPAPPESPTVIEVTATNFHQEVLQAPQPVIVDFWAEWCGPCQPLKPILHELAAEYASKIKFCSLDVDKAQQIAGQHQIRAIPCLIMFKEGQEVARQVGLVPKATLKSWIDQHLQP